MVLKFINLFNLCIVLAFTPACTQQSKKMEPIVNTETKGPKHFVFVPGSFHGAWCWFKMQPLLSKNGNSSIAIDLPKHGLDTTAPAGVTLDQYVDAVCKVLEQYDEPVVLVGHSRAGIILSQVAERMPEKIESLVYLCAFLIPDGEPMVATALTDTTSVLVSNLIFNEPEGWLVPKAEAYREAFYHDCSEEDLALCQSLLSKESIASVTTPLYLSANRFGKVKKVYIYTTEDRAVTYGLQKNMVARIPVDQVYALQSSHSPFLSRPKDLADILLKI